MTEITAARAMTRERRPPFRLGGLVDCRLFAVCGPPIPLGGLH